MYFILCVELCWCIECIVYSPWMSLRFQQLKPWQHCRVLTHLLKPKTAGRPISTSHYSRLFNESESWFTTPTSTVQWLNDDTMIFPHSHGLMAMCTHTCMAMYNKLSWGCSLRKGIESSLFHDDTNDTPWHGVEHCNIFIYFPSRASFSSQGSIKTSIQHEGSVHHCEGRPAPHAT